MLKAVLASQTLKTRSRSRQSHRIRPMKELQSREVKEKPAEESRLGGNENPINKMVNTEAKIWLNRRAKTMECSY